MITTTAQTLRCSFLPIVSKCPGALAPGEGPSVRIDAGEVTAGGSCVHEVCREIVRTGDRPEDLTPYLEKWPAADPDHVGRCTWYAREFWRLWQGAFTIDSECKPTLAHTELAMDMPLRDFHLRGTVDVHSSVSDDESRIIDWKAGYRTEVDVEAQMRGYALLSVQNFNHSEVTAVVVWLADQTYQKWTWTKEELLCWAEELGRSIEHWSGEYTTGEHCQYCPRLLACPAQRAMAKYIADALTVMSEEYKGGAGHIITCGQIAGTYTGVQQLERMIEQYRDMARKVVRVVGAIDMGDGMELRVVPSQRQGIDAKKGWPILAAALTEEELAPCVTIKKTELLGAIAAKSPRGTKAAAKQALMASLDAAGAIATKTIESLRVVRSKTPTTTGD